MARQDANQDFLQTSFLYGGNAPYIEDLYARYQESPTSVGAEWQAFFAGLKDEGGLAEANARGASWKTPNWPVPMNGELVSALDGNWAQIERAVGDQIRAKAQTKGAEISQAQVQQATRDSVARLMLIRAYRVRGHLHAKLDPLNFEPRLTDEELHPSHYGFTDADWDRRIFLDHVLGLEFGTIREIVAICDRTYCQTLGVEFMHISSPEEKAWIQERIEGPTRRSPSRRRASGRS
jgi:2-oxoglutarate dehydrogenase E1 component